MVSVISLYFVRCSVGVSVCLVCYMSDRVCELFGETIVSQCVWVSLLFCC